MSKIVVLLGSPRKNGNTEKLANAFIRGAESAGHQVTKFSVVDTKVNGCTGCDYCVSHGGQCVQKDGMQPVYEALMQADILVFASPVYYFGWTAQLKAMVDRFYALGSRLPVKAAAHLLALGGAPEVDAAAALANYKAVVDYMQWEDKGAVVAGEVMDKGDIDGKPALQEAEALGRHI